MDAHRRRQDRDPRSALLVRAITREQLVDHTLIESPAVGSRLLALERRCQRTKTTLRDGRCARRLLAISRPSGQYSLPGRLFKGRPRLQRPPVTARFMSGVSSTRAQWSRALNLRISLRSTTTAVPATVMVSQVIPAVATIIPTMTHNAAEDFTGSRA